MGTTGAAFIGKAVEQVKESASAAGQIAAPLAQTGIEMAKAHAMPVFKDALKQVEERGDKAMRAAVPFAERLLERAKAYLERKQK